MSSTVWLVEVEASWTGSPSYLAVWRSPQDVERFLVRRYSAQIVPEVNPFDDPEMPTIRYYATRDLGDGATFSIRPYSCDVNEDTRSVYLVSVEIPNMLLSKGMYIFSDEAAAYEKAKSMFISQPRRSWKWEYKTVPPTLISRSYSGDISGELAGVLDRKLSEKTAVDAIVRVRLLELDGAL